MFFGLSQALEYNKIVCTIFELQSFEILELPFFEKGFIIKLQDTSEYNTFRVNHIVYWAHISGCIDPGLDRGVGA
jgi:hypothetical protein